MWKLLFGSASELAFVLCFSQILKLCHVADEQLFRDVHKI